MALNLRLPPHLDSLVREEASIRGMSLNAYIVQVLFTQFRHVLKPPSMVEPPPPRQKAPIRVIDRSEVISGGLQAHVQQNLPKPVLEAPSGLSVEEERRRAKNREKRMRRAGRSG